MEVLGNCIKESLERHEMSFFFNKQQEEKTINVDYPNLLSSCLLIADYIEKYSIGFYPYMISISYN